MEITRGTEARLTGGTASSLPVTPAATEVQRVKPVADKVINEMDLVLSNDYTSLRQLENMLRMNPEQVIPPGDATRLLVEVADRIKKMGKDAISSVVKPENLNQQRLYLLTETNKLEQNFGLAAEPA
jgi:hypothetical protein